LDPREMMERFGFERKETGKIGFGFGRDKGKGCITCVQEKAEFEKRLTEIIRK